MPTPTPTSTDRAPGLIVAAGVLGLEAVALVGLAVLQFAQAGSTVVVATGGAFLTYAVLLGIVARGVSRRRRWSRGPAVATQLIQLPIAWTLRDGPTAWFGAAIGLTAIVAIVSLLIPSSTSALVAPTPDPE